MPNKKSSRRRLLQRGALAAAALTTTPLLGNAVPQTDSTMNNPSTPEFAGRVAFITGGARGIGLASAEELARGGADIVLFDVAMSRLPGVGYPLASPEDLQAARAKIEALGVRCLAIRGDVRDKSALDAAVKRTVDTFGSLDILVVNAGVTQVGAIEEFTAEELQSVYDINVLGAIKTTQAAAPVMRRRKAGHIVFLSSALGRMGNALYPVYASTKWALIGFAKSAALTYGGDNIRCNVIAPGIVDTPLADNDYVLRKMLPDDPNPTFAKVSAMLKPGNPLPVGHLEATDVARMVKVFCSEATAKVTGEVFDLSYGSLATSIA